MAVLVLATLGLAAWSVLGVFAVGRSPGLHAGVTVSHDIQLWITVLAFCAMLAGLVPKPWKASTGPRHRRPAKLGRAAVALLAVVLLAAALVVVAGCSSPPGSPARPESPAATAAGLPRQVGMQLPARTSIGTGAQARLWAAALSSALVARPTQADRDSFIAWFGAEDDHRPAGAFTYGAGENNPLNLTASSGSFTGVVGSEPSGAGPGHPGNLDFGTWKLGVQATVAVIWVKYPVLARALTSGRGLLHNPAVAADLERWSGGGYRSLP